MNGKYDLFNKQKCEMIGDEDWIPFPKIINIVWIHGDSNQEVLNRCIETFSKCHPLWVVNLIQ
jgi:hypothetical protein